MDEFPVLERAADLDQVRQLLVGLPKSGGRTVLVEGEAGIGKTRLIEEIKVIAEERSMLILSASGSEMETKFPFGIVRQLFGFHLARTAAHANLLTGAAAAAAHVFDGTGGMSRQSEPATLHGLFWLTANFCTGPTLMVIDDLHWCDAASLRYLAYLLPRLQELPLLAVASVRTGEQPQDQLLFDHILTSPSVVELRPAPLSEAASHTLMEAIIGTEVEPAFSAACQAATAGNPLLLHALARTVALNGLPPTAANSERVASLGPEALSRWVAPRLAHVSETTRRIAEAASVLGPGAQLDTLAQMAETNLLFTAEATSELSRLGLLKVDETKEFSGRSITFAHALVQAAVYGTLSDRQRAEAHRRAAAVLTQLGADVDRIAAHVLKTPPGGYPPVIPLMRRAAEAAILRGSPETGHAYLRRALQEDMTRDQRLALLREAAAVAVQVDLNEAALLLEEARTCTTDSAVLADINARLGAAYGFLREPDRAIDALQESLSHLPEDSDDERRRLEATLLVAVFVVPGRVGMRDRLPELRRLPAHDSVGGRMLDCMIASHRMAIGVPDEQHRAHEALADGQLVEEINGEGPLVCGWISLLAADDPLGMTSTEQAVKYAQRRGSLRALAPAYCFRALALLWSGQLAEAESDARTALGLTETGRVDMDPAFAGAYLAQALIEQGRLGEAESVLDQLNAALPNDPPRPCYYVLDARTRLLREQGHHLAALRTAKEACDIWDHYGFCNPALASWRTDASLSLVALERHEEARELARREVDLAVQWGAPRAHGRALRTLARVTGGSEGLALLRDSVAVLEKSTSRLELAKSLVDFGSALREDGQRVQAQDALKRGLDHADVCGALPLVKQFKAELRAAGFRPRRTRATGPDALTPGERRVAAIAATGSTNREIAQELFITPKTVEVHLSSVYRKLNISRRDQLAGFAGELDQKQ
jgi:DNA-binding CsgD family transcriptional regulator/tetratricopeptide (TPR) repeat protein